MDCDSLGQSSDSGTAVPNVCSRLGTNVMETGVCQVAGVPLISRMMQISRECQEDRGVLSTQMR
jgi:hypothetical protein